ncbi:ATP-binding protein [Methylocella sp.]|uniref:ATP-binding protein n=1 Tax=Methylocella sp. TaxID=1978226 RepID=UPI0035AE5DC4
MTGISFSPGYGDEDVATALRLLSPRLALDAPLLAMGAGDERRVVFASAPILRLFGAGSLEGLSLALRAPQAAERAPARQLAALAQNYAPGGPARLERLSFPALAHPVIFLCRRLDAPAPLFVAAALDMPASLRAAPAQDPPAARDDATATQGPPESAPARFVWRAGPDDALVEVGDALELAAGEPAAAFLGVKLARLVGAFDADRGLELQRLFDRRQSWRGFSVDWPSPDDAFVASVSLAGSPVFDGERRFLGYRGFGLVLSRRPAAPRAAPGGAGGVLDLRRRLAEAWPRGAEEGPNDDAGAAGGAILNAQERAAYDGLPTGVLVVEAGAALFANRFLLDALGEPDLRSARLSGALEPVLSRRDDAEGAAVVLFAGGRSVRFALRRARLARGERDVEIVSLAPEPEAPAARAAARRLAEERREARELNAILDTAMDGVCVLDARGAILRLNRAGEALFGCESAEVAGRDFTILVAPESRERAKAYFAALGGGGLAGVFNDGREILGLTRRGGAIPLFITLGEIGEAGDPRAEPRYCALLRDMTHWKTIERELKDARSEAERASALKSDFLAKVSHEIRTPLNAILGFAEVMLEERFGPVGTERYKEYLKDIHSSGALVMSLVNDLLDLSKIEAGKMELAFEAADLNRIVAECVSIMQPQASGARVVIGLSLAPQLPQIYADERSVRQITLNLLSNAIKFTEGGGQVVVSTALNDQNCAALRVRDTGVGMSEDDLKIALQPFGQASRGRAAGGTGLGLPLTKALVEANRAAFSIRSKPDEGTLVEIAFPPARIVAARK